MPAEQGQRNENKKLSLETNINCENGKYHILGIDLVLHRFHDRYNGSVDNKTHIEWLN